MTKREELEQAIRTVMVFDGYKFQSSECLFDVWINTDNNEKPFILDKNVIESHPIYKDWSLLHPVWEKFREMTPQYSDIEQANMRSSILSQHRHIIGLAIINSTKMEAFAALYEGITWFNGLNKKA